jgi:hypothetical protein
MLIAWRVSDLPSELAELPETGAQYVADNPKTYSVKKAARAIYNAFALAGFKDPVAKTLADLKRRKIIKE